MSGRLIYVIGPSGSGKDSLIDHVRRHVPPGLDVRIARRLITRPMSAGAEQHLAVSPYQFDLLLAEGQFALNWSVGEVRYGVGREILDWLANDAIVIVNGSRKYLPQALQRFPSLEAVYVEASPSIRRARLMSRLREDERSIEMRLARAVDWQPPTGLKLTRIVNEGPLDAAGSKLLSLVESRAGRRRAAVSAGTTAGLPARSDAPPAGLSLRPMPHRKAVASLNGVHR